MGTLLKLIGLGVVLYAIYYFFVKKYTYTFKSDYNVPLTAAELQFIRKPGDTAPVYVFRTGETITGTENRANGTFQVHLTKFQLPTIIKEIPMGVLTKSKPVFPLF